MMHIIQILTDPDFRNEDREFHLRTLQGQWEVDRGEVRTFTEEEFKERWEL